MGADGKLAMMDLIRGAEIADRSTLEMVFETYLGRVPPDDVLLHFQSKNYKASGLEKFLYDSPEFRLSGRVIQSRFRQYYDGARLVIAPAKLICCPIYKVANTSIKDWILRLHGADANEHSTVHGAIESTDIPLTLKKWTFTDLDRLRHDKAWETVAVLRDPLERLVSCYWDKFVVHRQHPLNLVHTLPVYKFFNQGKDPSPDQIQKGLSFHQLCQYINLSERAEMDPHWAAQFVFVQEAKVDHLFHIENISDFEDFVRSRLPAGLQTVRLGLHNAARKTCKSSFANGDLASSEPHAFRDSRKPPASTFVTPDIELFIRDYYWLDYKLIDSVARVHGRS